LLALLVLGLSSSLSLTARGLPLKLHPYHSDAPDRPQLRSASGRPSAGSRRMHSTEEPCS